MGEPYFTNLTKEFLYRNDTDDNIKDYNINKILVLGLLGFTNLKYMMEKNENQSYNCIICGTEVKKRMDNHIFYQCKIIKRRATRKIYFNSENEIINDGIYNKEMIPGMKKSEIHNVIKQLIPYEEI